MVPSDTCLNIRWSLSDNRVVLLFMSLTRHGSYYAIGLTHVTISHQRRGSIELVLTNARPRITRSGSRSAHLMRRSRNRAGLACDIDKILLSWYCMPGVRTPERRRASWENRGERTRNADPAAPVAEPIALVRIRTETQRETLMPESNLNFQVERAAGDRCRSALERHRSSCFRAPLLVMAAPPCCNLKEKFPRSFAANAAPIDTGHNRVLYLVA